MPESDIAATTQETLVSNAALVTEHLNQALVKVGEWVEATEGLVVENMPLLVKEILAFEIAEKAFVVVLGLLFIGWALYAWRWSHRSAVARLERIKEHTKLLKGDLESRGKPYGDTADCIFSFQHFAIPVTGVVGAIIGVCMVLCNFMDLLKPMVAPRLFLVEYFRQLVQ